jgi:hypothetical protein
MKEMGRTQFKNQKSKILAGCVEMGEMYPITPRLNLDFAGLSTTLNSPEVKAYAPCPIP